MKKSAIIITLAAVILPAVLNGKTVRRTMSIIQSSVPETTELGVENMEFVYDYSYCVDTTGALSENMTSDRMLLQISPTGLSKFSSHKNLTIDSILPYLSTDQRAAAAMEGKLSNGEFMTIYKNYPEGKLTHTEKICTDWFKYEEDMPQFDWELTDSTVNVLGYDCHEAKCTFRGRDWTVYYTDEIPVMEGPWKFHGLPGLIMKATDKNGEYRFECVGINSKGVRPITIYNVPFNVTSRPKYYDTKHRYECNPYAYAEETAAIHVTVSDEAGNPVLDSYDPIDLLFDYIETDWKDKK